MKAFYHILAIVILVYGIVWAVKGDQETFKFAILIGMLCNIYAEIID